MKIPDCSDPGKAALVYYVACQLSARVAMMDAANRTRREQGFSDAYDESAYQAAIDEAELAAPPTEGGKP